MRALSPATCHGRRTPPSCSATARPDCSPSSWKPAPKCAPQNQVRCRPCSDQSSLCAAAAAEPAARGASERPAPRRQSLRATGILDYCLQIRLPEAPDDLLGQLTLARRIPGSQVVHYRGLQGFFVRQARRAYQSRWRRSLRDTYTAGGLDTFEMGERYNAMGDAQADQAAGGRWWSRTWLDSLTPERGGAPAQPSTHVIGTQITMISLGPFSLTNDFRARLDGGYFGMGVDPSPGRVFRDLAEVDVARDYATYQRQSGDDEALPDLTRAEQHDVEDEDDPPARRGRPDRLRFDRGELLELQVAAIVPQPDLAWQVRFRPEARVRVRPGQPMRARIGVRASVEFWMGPPRARQRVVEVTARVRYDLHDRDMVASVQVQLVAW